MVRCLDRGSCHVKCLAVWTTESACCYVPHRHLYDAINMRVGRYPDDTSTIEATIPKISFCIDTGTIRKSLRESLQKRPAISYGPGDKIVIVNPDDVLQCVAEVEASVIWAPGKCVGDAKIAAPLSDGTVGIQAIEQAVIALHGPRGAVRVHVVVHRADPE